MDIVSTINIIFIFLEERHTSSNAGSSEESLQVVNMLLILGGMDAEGNIFDDCLALRI